MERKQTDQGQSSTALSSMKQGIRIFLLAALAVAAIVGMKYLGAEGIVAVFPAVLFGTYYVQKLNESGFIEKVVIRIMEYLYRNKN